uniref:Variant surface glycoprotein 1125.185 n=1 Tax=Trypanosoma brucei TaxID=5691 RepID=A0A1J0R5A4_9TRYP|nr:variant surface glycoprotein 1125.185 [Trypanosoma brucei]
MPPAPRCSASVDARYLVIAAALVELLLTKPVRAAQGGLKEAEWKPLCQLGIELRKAPALALHQTQILKSSQQQQRKLAVKLQLFSITGAEGEEIELAAAAAVALAEEAATTAAALGEYAEKAIKSVTTTSALRGAIEEALNILDTGHSNGGTSFCLGNSAGSSAWSGKSDADHCITRNWNTDASSEAVNPDALDDKGFKTITTTTHDLSAGGRTATMCGFFKVGTLGTNAIPTGKTLQVANGIWTISADDNVVQQNLATLTPSGTRVATSLQAAAHYDLHALNSDRIEATPEDETALLKKSDMQEKIKTKLKQLVKQRLPTATTTKLQAEVDRIVKDKLDPTGNKVKDLITKVEGTKVPIPSGKLGETKKLSALSSETEIQDALIYKVMQLKQENKQLSEEKEKKEEPKSNNATPSDDKCKQHKEPGPCEKAGCNFDASKNYGEKCFPNPEAKEAEKQEGKDEKIGSFSTYVGKEEKYFTGNCKWEETECKDSSFLVNKKLALMVSAFLSLPSF